MERQNISIEEKTKSRIKAKIKEREEKRKLLRNEVEFYGPTFFKKLKTQLINFSQFFIPNQIPNWEKIIKLTQLLIYLYIKKHYNIKFPRDNSPSFKAI